MIFFHARLPRRILTLIPRGVTFMICFSSSIVVRACREFLLWRYREFGVITKDCDIIFENDPSKDLQRSFRRWNRVHSIPVDWWESSYYKESWDWVKNHGLENRQIINRVPVQPFQDLVWTKKNLLQSDPKHQRDLEHLPSF